MFRRGVLILLVCAFCSLQVVVAQETITTNRLLKLKMLSVEELAAVTVPIFIVYGASADQAGLKISSPLASVSNPPGGREKS